jgi:hypothetical protein
MEADARPAVVNRLQQMGYFPIAINGVRGGKLPGNRRPRQGRRGLRSPPSPMPVRRRRSSDAPSPGR